MLITKYGVIASKLDSGGITASDDIFYTSTNVTSNWSWNNTIVDYVQLDGTGSVRTKFTIEAYCAPGYRIHAQIYVNDVAAGTLRQFETDGESQSVTYTEDINISANDYISLVINDLGDCTQATIKGFKLGGTGETGYTVIV